jgi:ATP-dependent protease ClpP protease subunit
MQYITLAINNQWTVCPRTIEGKTMSKKASNFDLADIFGKQTKQDDKSFCKPIVHIHEFYLSGVIESADAYIQWFDTIRHAGSNDAIKIYINSYGGDINTAIQMLRILNDTEATVIVSIEGACMSAATMVLMVADSVEVSPHSQIMFHNYSGGTIGKGSDMHSQIEFERMWSIKLMNGVYEDFLSKEEIQKLLDGSDLWMDGDEVVKRLEAKNKKDKPKSKSKKKS